MWSCLPQASSNNKLLVKPVDQIIFYEVFFLGINGLKFWRKNVPVLHPGSENIDVVKKLYGSLWRLLPITVVLFMAAKTAFRLTKYIKLIVYREKKKTLYSKDQFHVALKPVLSTNQWLTLHHSQFKMFNI